MKFPAFSETVGSEQTFADRLLCLSLDIGEAILESGGEVHRVEDTIQHVCHAYGAVHVEVFSIISVINAAIRMPDGSYSSQMRRVKSTSNNLYKLELYNEISREICAETPSLEEFDRRLHAVKNRRAYPTWVSIPAASSKVVSGNGLETGTPHTCLILSTAPTISTTAGASAVFFFSMEYKEVKYCL